ncbi:hypothetical protein PVK06_025130 [Gossypium arboreum]|uniref:Ionotropic glutamate receptor C-terminal domain-containing protein n=2 Tax=Gossypium arboreum TaxID=29729 RepID=A0ABR0PFY9_GOSAR|nr:hypothetical protein PVK06_025130 [Gossypium arboreum]
MSLQTTVLLVHMSPTLASRLFLNARRLGMMSQGYAWITTDMITNFMNSMDPSVIESMQGVVGFKPHIPASKELRKLAIRWRSKNLNENQNLEEMEINVYGIWSYDMVWAVATAAERVMTRYPHILHQVTRMNMNFTTIRSSQSGLVFMDEILQSTFKGISGGFQLTNGRLIPKEFEIVNVFKGERIIGYWNPGNGITSLMKQENHNEMNSTSSSKLESVIWPGGTMNIPRGWSLHGKRLRIGVPANNGFREIISVTRDPRTNETTVTGYCVDVFKEAVQSLGYEVHYDFIPFEDASGKIAGTYDDLILQVYYKNYDAVVGDTTILARRFQYVDFTMPFTDIGIGTVVPKINKKSIWIFLMPLSGDLWITTAAFFILTGLVVWFIERPINEEFQGSPCEQIGMIFWYSFSTLVFAHKEKLLSNLSKFVVIIWVFVVLIITSSYTATLASMLTVQQIELNSKQDYVGYHYGFVLSRAVSNLNFKNPRLKPYNSPEEYADALGRGSNNGGVSAIIDEIPYLKVFLAKYPSDYTIIKSMTTSGGFGFVFPKGPPLVQDISSAIMRLREEEKLQLVENKWFNSTESIFTDQDTTKGYLARNALRYVGLLKRQMGNPRNANGLLIDSLEEDFDFELEDVSISKDDPLEEGFKLLPIANRGQLVKKFGIDHNDAFAFWDWVGGHYSEEDAALVACMVDLHNAGTFNADTGFKAGYLNELEKMVEKVLPNAMLKAKPNLESRIRTLKRDWSIIYDMLTPNLSWEIHAAKKQFSGTLVCR